MVLASSAAKTAIDVIIGIVVASWALMFALFIGMALVVTVTRGRRLRRGPRSAVTAMADPQLPAALARLRAGDPRFDERLLLEQAQMACLVIFAATSTGDEDLLKRIDRKSVV